MRPPRRQFNLGQMMDMDPVAFAALSPAEWSRGAPGGPAAEGSRGPFATAAVTRPGDREGHAP